MICGRCAFMLFFDDISSSGWCYKNKSSENHPQIDAENKSCKNWIDCNVRYSSQLKKITDKNTLDWLQKVINEAFINRTNLDQK